MFLDDSGRTVRLMQSAPTPLGHAFGYRYLPIQFPPHVLNNISGRDSAEDPSLLDKRMETNKICALFYVKTVNFLFNIVTYIETIISKLLFTKI